MGILDEFKTFIRRGNVMDLAVGIIIGAAFGKIVSSLVEGLFMPVLGWVLSGVNFADLILVLKRSDDGTPRVSLEVGRFVQSLVDFLIISICVFVLIKVINRIQGPRQEAPKPPPEEVRLLTEIRDLLQVPPNPDVGASQNPVATHPNVAPPARAG